MLPLRVRVDLGVMAMKGYSTFLRAAGLEPRHQIKVISRTLVVGGVSYASAEIQSMYSTVKTV